MNVLIFEYITGGGLVDVELPASLVKEGELMLDAVASDFEELPGINVSVLRDYRLHSKEYTNPYIVSREYGYAETIASIEKNIDAILIIAPEKDGILSSLCEDYDECEFILLNSSSSSTALLSDKLKTYQYLKNYRIPQIPSYAVKGIGPHQSEECSGMQDNLKVLKPKDGVGCENIKILTSSTNNSDVIKLSDLYNYIEQPYINGQSASLSLLCYEGECLLLSANIQSVVEIENSFELQQCIVNALQRDNFIEFSNKLIAALPGLRGYIGVDIIITDDETLLVEINPRLTTSYAGLKSALGLNPADLMLQTFVKEKLPYVEFTSDRTVTVKIGEERAA